MTDDNPLRSLAKDLKLERRTRPKPLPEAPAYVSRKMAADKAIQHPLPKVGLLDVLATLEMHTAEARDRVKLAKAPVKAKDYLPPPPKPVGLEDALLLFLEPSSTYSARKMELRKLGYLRPVNHDTGLYKHDEMTPEGRAWLKAQGRLP